MIIKFKLFEQAEDITDWKLKLDISKIWNESIYDDGNKLIEFNDNLINFLNTNKDLIIKQTSLDAWNKLQELIVKLNESKNDLNICISIWDDIYDWGDGNMVEIITNTIENDF